MARVPRNRNTQLELLRSGRQKAIFVGGVPIPAGEDALPGTVAHRRSLVGTKVWDEICGEAELMGTLKRSRFCNTLGQQITLPQWVAESLEDMEAGLREVGLIRGDEVLCQSFASPAKFRVKQSHVSDYSHARNPSVKAAVPSGPVPSLTEGQKPLDNPVDGSRALSGASLDAATGLAYARFVSAQMRRRRRG